MNLGLVPKLGLQFWYSWHQSRVFLRLTVSEVFFLLCVREICPHPEDAKSLRKNEAVLEKHQPQPPQAIQAYGFLGKGPLVSSALSLGLGRSQGPAGGSGHRVILSSLHWAICGPGQI